MPWRSRRPRACLPGIANPRNVNAWRVIIQFKVQCSKFKVTEFKVKKSIPPLHPCRRSCRSWWSYLSRRHRRFISQPWLAPSSLLSPPICGRRDSDISTTWSMRQPCQACCLPVLEQERAACRNLSISSWRISAKEMLKTATFECIKLVDFVQRSIKEMFLGFRGTHHEGRVGHIGINLLDNQIFRAFALILVGTPFFLRSLPISGERNSDISITWSTKLP